MSIVQAKETALLRTDGSATDQVVQEISSLAQLESIVEASGSSIVAVALYTRVQSCQSLPQKKLPLASCVKALSSDEATEALYIPELQSVSFK